MNGIYVIYSYTIKFSRVVVSTWAFTARPEYEIYWISSIFENVFIFLVGGGGNGMVDAPQNCVIWQLSSVEILHVRGAYQILLRYDHNWKFQTFGDGRWGGERGDGGKTGIYYSCPTKVYNLTLVSSQNFHIRGSVKFCLNWIII